MKKRTFFTTLLLFLIFMYGMLCFIVCMMLRERMETATQKALSEQYMITVMMWNDMKAFEEKGGLSKENLQIGMRQYSEIVKQKTTTIALCKAGEIFYQNREIETSLETLMLEKEENLQEGERTTGYQKLRESYHLYIVGMLPKPYENYSLFYYVDLSKMIKEWKEFRMLLFSGGTLLSLILSGCLLLLVKKIFAPLYEIAKTSEEIAQGQYEKRLPMGGGYEVAAMAESRCLRTG